MPATGALVYKTPLPVAQRSSSVRASYRPRGHSLRAMATAGGTGKPPARYGVREDTPDGGCMETYGFDLGGGKVGKETYKFRSGSKLVPLCIERPLGIVFEQKEFNGMQVCQVDELVPGSNAEKAGVEVGDVLR